MKRFFAFLIAVMMLSTVFLTAGCSIVTRGSDYCYRFLDYICAGSFDKAYEMLADSIKAPETEEEREDRLKAEEKEKEENRKIWRQVFGLDKADTPAPEATEPKEPSQFRISSTSCPIVLPAAADRRTDSARPRSRFGMMPRPSPVASSDSPNGPGHLRARVLFLGNMTG